MRCLGIRRRFIFDNLSLAAPYLLPCPKGREHQRYLCMYVGLSRHFVISLQHFTCERGAVWCAVLFQKHRGANITPNHTSRSTHYRQKVVKYNNPRGHNCGHPPRISRLGGASPLVVLEVTWCGASSAGTLSVPAFCSLHKQCATG